MIALQETLAERAKVVAYLRAKAEREDWREETDCLLQAAREIETGAHLLESGDDANRGEGSE